MEDNLKRLNKFIGETGFCSRREADKLIEDGRVTLNGEIPLMGTKVTPDDEVRIDGKLIREKNEKPVYLAFNKPPGIECTTNLEVDGNIVDYINYPKRIFPIGRLDKASEGLIFMTNDGDIVNKILRARNNHEKEYVVTVKQPISDRFIFRMGNGIPILDTVTNKCKVEQISKFVFKIVLTQGLNRQIRRMTEYLGYDVTALKRIRIINISLDVPLGRHRDLTEAEITELNQLIEPSTMTEEGSYVKPVSSRPPMRQRPDRPSSSSNRPFESRQPSFLRRSDSTDSGDSRDHRNSRDDRGSRDRRESRESGSRDSDRGIFTPRDSRDSGNSRDSRDNDRGTFQPRDNREPRDSDRRGSAPRNNRESRDGGDSRDSRGSRDNDRGDFQRRDNRDFTNSRDTRDSRDNDRGNFQPRDNRNSRDSRDSRDNDRANFTPRESESPSNNQPRKAEYIKKDDPKYKNKGDY